MDEATKKKIKVLMNRVESVQNRIDNILKECAKSNNETLLFWSGKEEELKKEYQVLKTVYSIIIKYIIENEYWKKAKSEVQRVNGLKSVNKHIRQDYKEKQIHTRTINILYQNAYNSFATAIDTGLKERVKLLNNIQQAVVKVNRVKELEE
jgi:hypothetical protein